MKRFILKGTIAALFSFSAFVSHAGYAQLQPPAGWSNSSSGPTFNYGAAANSATISNGTVRTNASLNVGGKIVNVPASMRFSANAGRVAATAAFLNPTWFVVAGLVVPGMVELYDYYESNKVQVHNGAWKEALKSSMCVPNEPGCTPPPDPPGIDPADKTTFVYTTDGPFDEGGCGYQGFRGGVSVGYWCVGTPKQSENFETITLPKFVEIFSPKPIPNILPQKLPVPLPVETPVINPTPGNNPQSQPLFVPTGNPVPNPNYNPQAAPSPQNQPFLQPGVRVTPTPTPSSPWQVDLQPVNRPVADPTPNPNPVTDPVPNPNDQPNPDGEDEAGPTDTPLGDIPELYQKKYPDGISGVVNGKISELKATPLFNLPSLLMPSLPSSGSCPSWQIDLGIASWAGMGTHTVQAPCMVWDFGKVVIIISALLLARRLIFGG